MQGAVMLNNRLAVDKSTGLQHVADELGLRSEEFCVFGDEANDWGMFAWAVSTDVFARSRAHWTDWHLSLVISHIDPEPSVFAAPFFSSVRTVQRRMEPRDIQLRRPMLFQRQSVVRQRSRCKATTTTL